MEGQMDLIEKLKKLIPHWQEHNGEHAGNYRKWSLEAQSQGYTEVAAILNRLYAESMKLDDLFKEAEKEVQRTAKLPG